MSAMKTSLTALSTGSAASAAPAEQAERPAGKPVLPRGFHIR